MRRTRNIAKIVDSSDSDDDIPLKKLQKSANTTSTLTDERKNDSSSESDIENYLQPIHKIDLNSSFFNTQSKNVQEFDKIEKNLFSGITRLSDSESDVEEDVNEIVQHCEDTKQELKQTESNPGTSGYSSTKLNFRQLEEYTRQIEEAKKHVEKYNAKKKASKNMDNNTDILNLLAAGESKQITLENIKPEDLHSSDFESCDSEQDDWEEVKVKDPQEAKEGRTIPKEGLQIIVDMPETCRKKKGVDLLAAMKRRLNRIRKENQVYVHKVHLLCWIAHGNYVNAAINNTETLGLALSLLPSDKCYPSDRTDLNYLEQIVQWYKKTIRLVEKPVNKKLGLVDVLKTQISKKEAHNKKNFVYIFIAILRALGIQCRLVLSFQVEPLRPPASELHSLAMEDTKGKSKNKNMKNNTNSTDKIKSLVAKESSDSKTNKKKETNSSKLPNTKPGENKTSTEGKSSAVKTSQAKITKPKLKEISSTISNTNSKSKKNVDSKEEKLKEISSTISNTNSKSKKNVGSKEEKPLKQPLKAKAESVQNNDVSKEGKKSNKTKLDIQEIRKGRSKSNSNTEFSATEEGKSANSKSNRDKNKEKNLTVPESKRRSKSVDNSETKETRKGQSKTNNNREITSAEQQKSGSKNIKSVADKNKEKNLAVPEPKRRSKSEGSTETKEAKSVTAKSKKTTKKDIIKVKFPKKQKTNTVAQLDGADDSSEEDTIYEFIIPQLDGADDKKKQAASKRPNLKKLSTQEETCKVKKHPSRLKSRDRDYNSEDDFRPRSPFTKKNTESPKLVENRKVNLHKLKDAPRKAKEPPKKQLDIKNDIINLIKGRITEQKHVDKRKQVNKRKLPSNDSDSDSDFMPEPVKKKHHDSDSDIEYFVPKPKVKKRIRVVKKESGLKVLSSESDPENSGKKKGNNVWAEVFLESEEKWISVDVIRGQVHCVKELYSRATHPVSYIVAWNNNNNLKDVTKRYCTNFNTITRKLRIDVKWWDETLKPFLGKYTVRDKEEDDDLNRQQLDQPLPTSIAEYKNHPLYALRRHLLKFEAIYPPDIQPLGYVRSEPVYPRNSVYVCRSRDIWLKEAKVVKPGEKPYKIVKARPKYDKLSNTVITDQLLEIFGEWQTMDYEPPTAENGVVPRNAFGNVELFKPCMLPKGTVHLKLPGLNKVCRRMDIDCASAIVGFDFHSGWSHPLYDGFVVCEEFADSVVAAWELEQDEIERKENEKIEKRVYGNWKKLIRGLLIRERLKAKYDFGEAGKSGDGKDKKPKGPRFCTKKR